MRADSLPLWIFAYGSLMWRPDFQFVERQRATLSGYHRALCIRSHHYRGTVERPGLVLGLDGGGVCVGVAFRIEPAKAMLTLAAVRRRELITGVYREIAASVTLADGRTVDAIAYAADPSHEQYAGSLSFAAVVEMVDTSSGISGSNRDYVRNTQAHLLDLGVDEPELTKICAALDPISNLNA